MSPVMAAGQADRAGRERGNIEMEKEMTTAWRVRTFLREIWERWNDRVKER
jgi:hypothetical protein